MDRIEEGVVYGKKKEDSKEKIEQGKVKEIECVIFVPATPG